MENNFVITVARGFGSGGKQIASKLADRLGINCYEHRILALASQYTGYDESYFEDEKLNGRFFAGILTRLPISVAPRPNTTKFVSDQRTFEAQKHIIRQLAETESCVIVGKCADYILRDKTNVISVYIEAPRRYCLKRLMERMPELSEEEANKLITKTDKYRADYYKYYTGGNNWTNVVNYDLTINAERVGEEQAIQLILDYVERKFGVRAK